MNNNSRILLGAASIATMLAMASPAVAQQPYPNPNGGVVGAIIDSVTGGGYRQYPQGSYGYGNYPQSSYSYGNYPQGNYGYAQASQHAAVGMCAAAAEQRISGNDRPGNGYNNGYANGYGNNDYRQGYSNGYNRGAILGITNVERRYNGSLKVSGVASSGRENGYNYPGYDNRYDVRNAYANPVADLRFSCRVSSRGQVSEVKLSRNRLAYRGY